MFGVCGLCWVFLILLVILFASFGVLDCLCVSLYNSVVFILLFLDMTC